MGISEGILEAGPLPMGQAMEILGKGGPSQDIYIKTMKLIPWSYSRIT